MFPRTAVIAFAIIALIANAGFVAESVQETRKENLSSTEKASKLVRDLGTMLVKTPNRVDDFLGNSIEQAANPQNPSARRYAYGMIFLAGLGFYTIFVFFYRFIQWFIGLTKPPESEQRGKLLSVVITIIVLFGLTGYTFIRIILSLLA